MKKLQKQLLFLALFILVGFASLQIPFNKLAGSGVSFTLFDFFGPIAGSFLGPVFGIASVLIVELVNFFVKQTPITAASAIRLFPILFAVYYFAVLSKKTFNSWWILLVPALAIAAFLAHPIGRQVPYYTLFWFIPFIAYRFRRNLFMRSLGATFTAHAVGGAAWIWALNLPAQVWNGLIPVVIAERLLIASGIAISFLVTKKVLSLLASRKILPSLDATAV